MTEKTLQGLSAHEGKIRIFTHLIIRDDAFSLAGFIDTSELELFLLLITVNRVGPQMALSILSQISVQELVDALISEDEKRLTSLTGVGPRNARRLILELKDRVKDRAGQPVAGREDISGQVREDVAKALIALGFPGRDSYDAVNRAASGAVKPDSQVLLKSALAILKGDRRR
jgi:Holliday junction DNA helicase RuvA